MTATPLKAWRVTTPPLGREPGPVTWTEYALTRSKARYQAAAQLEDAGWVDRIGDALRAIRSVRRAPELDEPVRVIDPTLLPHQREILEHAIGEWRGRPGTQPYRNHYCDPPGSPRVGPLVALGWMALGRTINEGREVYAHVTPAGFRALGLPVPEEERC